MDPKVSVVIPTYNRVAPLRRTLAALAAQTLAADAFEVVVVSDGCVDGTDDYLRRTETPFSLISLSQTNQGPASARNHGLRVARGEIVLFLDDDIVPRPDLIEQHVLAHETSHSSVIVIGPMVTPPDRKLGVFARWEQEMLRRQYTDLRRGAFAPTYRQFYTGNASAPRSLLVECGGFDERFRRAEDVELGYRLHRSGARFIFNRFAVGHHYPERSFRSWISNARAYGRNEVLFARSRGEPGRLRIVGREFSSRSHVTQWVTRACLGRPWLESSLAWPIRGLIAIAECLRFERLTLPLLSGLYNISYYCGMAAELGGARAFRRFLASPQAHSIIRDYPQGSER
jgi:GT2 family glycosyltransferase